jgi:hypothetical protein
MAELIEVACDICGQKYRWSDERLGSTAACRECGTKFEVEEFVPPPDDADDEVGDSPLPWIKGALVAALIVAALSGLGSLLFTRPAPDAPVLASAAPSVPARAAQSSTTAAGAPSGQTQPSGVTATPATPRTGHGIARNGLPSGFGSGAAPSDPRKVRELADKLKSSVPGRASPAPGFGLSNTNDPEPEREATGSVPAPGPKPIVVDAPSGVPVVTTWQLVGNPGSARLRLTGRGLQKTTAVQELVGLALIDAAFAAVSDTELDVKKTYLKDPRQSLFVVASPEGIAVAFCDAVPIVTSRKSLDREPNSVRVFRVTKDGWLEGSRSAVVLVEAGGRAHIDSTVPIAFVKDEAEMAALAASNLFAEPRANVRQQNANPSGEMRPPVMTFCALPELKKD